MLRTVQVTSILLLFVLCAHAVKPPGYVKPPEVPDQNPPKYEYGYNVEDEKGASQGKVETRDGIYALGRYYVQEADSSRSVQYYADDWGYHPYIEYSNVGPHSKSRTQLLLGVEAVKALASNKFTPHSVPPKQQVTETINNRASKVSPIPQQQVLVQQPQVAIPQQQQLIIQEQPQIVHQQPQQHQVIVQQQQQQPVIIQEQPQIVHQQPQQHQVIVQQQQQQPQVVVHQQQQQVIQEQPQQILSQQPQVFTQQLPVQQHQQVFQSSVETLPQPLALIQEGANRIEDNLIASHQASQATLLENARSNTQQVLHQTQASLGGFGSRLNLVGRNKPNINVQIQSSPGRLIETTRNLVSGQDVLNINGAIDQSIETSTAKALTGISVTEASLFNQPIVVADVEEKFVTSTERALQENIFSTTASTVETLSTKSFGITEPSTVLVTPKSSASNFLLAHSSQNAQNIESSTARNYQVEIQKSLPLYLGKFEYPTGASAGQATVHEKAIENIELTKTLQAFPEQTIQLQQLPQVYLKENFVEVDQQQAQGQVTLQQVNNPVVVEKQVQTKIVEKPVHVTHVIKEQVPVEVPVHVAVQVPVPVEKRVPYPVPVERIVEKPVKVTEIVEKRVNVPQPYPVEKIVERPVHVPVEVTKYVDRPYPVQVPVAHPVPYPVERVVEKIVKQPYPVPVQVQVPVTVEKIVEKKVPVPHYIEKQVPVDRIVEKPVPHYIDRPYPVQVQVPVPIANLYSVALPVKSIQQESLLQSYPVKTIQDFQKQTQVVQSSIRTNQYLPPKSSPPNNGYLPPQNLPPNNGYLPPHNCDQINSYSNKNAYFTIPRDEYIGLAPPKIESARNAAPQKYRSARSNFNSNLRLEYGFMPPLRPSQEIDEHGNPITREKP